MYLREFSLTLPFQARRRLQSRRANTAVDPHLLAKVLALLPQVRVVDLHYISFQPPTHLLSAISVSSIHLEKVVLGTVYTTSTTYSRLIDIFSLFSNASIGKLEISGQWKNDTRDPSYVWQGPHLRVSSLLFVEHDPQASYSTWGALGAALDPDALINIDVSFLNFDASESFSGFLASTGSNLRSLRFDLTGVKLRSTGTLEIYIFRL